MDDILQNIFKLLQFKDLYVCMLTNKQFYEIINNINFWRYKYLLNYSDCVMIDCNYYNTCKIYHCITRLSTKYDLGYYHKNISYIYNNNMLNLSNEKIVGVPTEIYLLQNLTNLQLSYNNIGHIPTELCMMTNIQVLQMCNANLKLIPIEITLMNNLNTLVLCNTNTYGLDMTRYKNTITTIPIEMAQMKNLKCINLNNNPMDGIVYGFTKEDGQQVYHK